MHQKIKADNASRGFMMSSGVPSSIKPRDLRNSRSKSKGAIGNRRMGTKDGDFVRSSRSQLKRTSRSNQKRRQSTGKKSQCKIKTSRSRSRNSCSRSRSKSCNRSRSAHDSDNLFEGNAITNIKFIRRRKSTAATNQQSVRSNYHEGTRSGSNMNTLNNTKTKNTTSHNTGRSRSKSMTGR